MPVGPGYTSGAHRHVRIQTLPPAKGVPTIFPGTTSDGWGPVKQWNLHLQPPDPSHPHSAPRTRWEPTALEHHEHVPTGVVRGGWRTAPAHTRPTGGSSGQPGKVPANQYRAATAKRSRPLAKQSLRPFRVPDARTS